MSATEDFRIIHSRRDMLAVSDIQAETPYAQLNAASGKLADRADGEVSQPRELYVAHACWQLISLMSLLSHPSISCAVSHHAHEPPDTSKDHGK
uniref:Uncharacterized protein n=1 Tax=Oryza nivara TaxID=4536 RepID=A0A0E0GEM2_ORYNI